MITQPDRAGAPDAGDRIDAAANGSEFPLPPSDESGADRAIPPGPASHESTPPELAPPEATSQEATSRDLADEEPFELGAPGLDAALEALLLIADEPVPPDALAELTREPQERVVARLHDLAAQYRLQGRGFELRAVDGGWRYYTSASCADLVARHVTDGRQAKLSQASLETLAIIAYRQPVGRAGVSAVRGVSSDGVIRTLAARRLITEVGEDSTTGALLYGTTGHFLDRMGLSSLSELPPIADHVPDLTALDDFID